jgi:hypothetical protein
MLQATTLRAALVELGESIIEAMHQRLETQSRFPLRRGRSPLLDTLRAEVKSPSGNARDLAALLTVYVADYARYVEAGRRPGARKVPLDVLIAWIKRRRVGVGRTAKGRFTKRVMSVTQLAYAIQQAIYRRGIRGRPFIQAAFDAGQKQLETWLDGHALDFITADLDRELNAQKT